MKEIVDNTAYKKKRETYSLLASMPIVIAIVHLLATVFFQITLNYTEANGYTNLYAISLLYGSSIFATILASPTHDLSMLHSLPSLIGALVAIVMILCSSYAEKGKKSFLRYSLYLYILDTLFLLPSIVLSALKAEPISLTIVDMLLSVLLHAFSLFLLIFGTLVAKQLTLYEAKKKREEETIHRENLNK